MLWEWSETTSEVDAEGTGNSLQSSSHKGLTGHLPSLWLISRTQALTWNVPSPCSCRHAPSHGYQPRLIPLRDEHVMEFAPLQSANATDTELPITDTSALIFIIILLLIVQAGTSHLPCWSRLSPWLLKSSTIPIYHQEQTLARKKENTFPMFSPSWT